MSPALLPTAALTLSTIMPMPSWPESKGPGGFLPFFSGVFSLGEPERQLCFPPTRRGPASMPPRSATVTMHNHTAAESLSGTSGCNIDARSYLSGPFSGINKAKLPLFFCLLAHCRVLKSNIAAAFRHQQSTLQSLSSFLPVSAELIALIYN